MIYRKIESILQSFIREASEFLHQLIGASDFMHSAHARSAHHLRSKHHARSAHIIRRDFYEISCFAQCEIKSIPTCAKHISNAKRISYAAGIFHLFRKERISLKIILSLHICEQR